jgi:hypothetical protein
VESAPTRDAEYNGELKRFARQVYGRGKGMPKLATFDMDDDRDAILNGLCIRLFELERQNRELTKLVIKLTEGTT